MARCLDLARAGGVKTVLYTGSVFEYIRAWRFQPLAQGQSRMMTSAWQRPKHEHGDDCSGGTARLLTASQKILIPLRFQPMAMMDLICTVALQWGSTFAEPDLQRPTDLHILPGLRALLDCAVNFPPWKNIRPRSQQRRAASGGRGSPLAPLRPGSGGRLPPFGGSRNCPSHAGARPSRGLGSFQPANSPRRPKKVIACGCSPSARMACIHCS